MPKHPPHPPGQFSQSRLYTPAALAITTPQVVNDHAPYTPATSGYPWLRNTTPPALR